MEHLLFLVHRIPFPPNKGDKIRSYHLLRYLSSRYRVHLGTFVDDPADLQYVEALKELTASSKVVSLNPTWARLRSLSGILRGEALTLPYYRNAELHSWVEGIIATHGIRKAVVFSSAMAQYATGVPGLRWVLDLVDVDSAKWVEYAERRSWPVSGIFRREGDRLFEFERRAAASSSASVLVTRGEADLFIRLAPENRERVHVIENGVDSAYFSPRSDRDSPYPEGEKAIVFTGSMDYWPNVDAVVWFVREVLPAIVEARPRVRFYVVGMNPAPAVRTLARNPGVVVTGRVTDVRPYLQFASVVVAPLRLARGVQNKVLEAMAMARPVVVSTQAATGVAGRAGMDFEVAADASEFTRKVLAVLNGTTVDSMGESARSRIVSACNWERNMSQFGALLNEPERARLECTV